MNEPSFRNLTGAELGADLVRRDLAAVWHPCTQMKDHETLPLLPVRRAEGVWLELHDGRRVLDGMSSWWVNLFGHCHPTLVKAAQDQAATLEHVIMAGFTHEPIVDLSESLVRLAPPGLTRCFYADNGSAAIEVALKMSFHYWRNTGRSRKTRFITLSNGYHGETLGALSVGDVDLFKDTYRPLLLEVITVPSPDAFHREPGSTPAEHARKMFAHMEATLARHADEVAAVIVEPLVQCAGGMRMYDPEYLRLLRAACDVHGVHLIADEIAVGFGRTGTLFACEQANIRPDFLCLSKGLTGGWLPLSVVMTTEQVYGAFYDDYVRKTAFLHSHSYTGNALACAVARATLRMFENEPWIERNRTTAAHMAQAVAGLADHPNVAEIRQTGMILAIEVVRDKATRQGWPFEERRGLRAHRHALSRGALLRPLGTVLYFMPPYVITPEEIRFLGEVAGECVDLIASDKA